MAYQFVTVNLSVATLDGSTGQSGSLTFEVSDFVLDMNTGAIVVVPPIVLAANGGFTGNVVQIPFLAMDDPSLSPNWAWILSATVAGRITPLPRRRFTINFANGAEQDFKTLALASTIIPA